MKKPTLEEWMQATQEEFVFDPEKQRALTLERLYRSGMAVADCLRLLGRHEESNQVETWTINNTKRVQNDHGNGD